VSSLSFKAKFNIAFTHDNLLLLKVWHTFDFYAYPINYSI